MLQEASVLKTMTDSDLKGPTQVEECGYHMSILPSFFVILQLHNLLQLIKKEQDIYNICFHELIRQVYRFCHFNAY